MSVRSLRDPAALGRLGWSIVALVCLWPLLVISQFRPGALFEAGNLDAMGFGNTNVDFHTGLLVVGMVEQRRAGVAARWMSIIYKEV